MRFDYEYRTSDNVRHTGVVAAADRDAAFAILKERGVKPIRVEASAGFFNKLFGKYKRWLAIVILAAVCAVLAFALRMERAERVAEPADETEVIKSLVKAGHPMDEIEQFLAERRRLEAEYRARIERRVKSGELTAQEADRLFKSLGLSSK